MILRILIVSMIWLTGNAVAQSALSAEPVIMVENPPVQQAQAAARGLHAKSLQTAAAADAIDTDPASPVAPQKQDGFDGKVQKPFAPTTAEKAQMEKQRQMLEAQVQEDAHKAALARQVAAGKAKKVHGASRMPASVLAKKAKSKKSGKKSAANKRGQLPRTPASLPKGKKSTTVGK